jgi:hypothetical protein
VDPVRFFVAHQSLRRAGSVLRELHEAAGPRVAGAPPFEEILAGALLRDACTDERDRRERGRQARAAAVALCRVARTLDAADRHVAGLILPSAPV